MTPLGGSNYFTISRTILAVCLLVATVMVATTAWSPVAAAATRSVTFAIQTPDGRPVAGLGLEWLATDGSARSSGCKMTDSAGNVRWTSVPITRILIAHCEWHYGTVKNGPTLTHLVRYLDIPASGPVVVSTGKVPATKQVVVKVRMPDGTPVADHVTVRPGNGFPRPSMSYYWGGENDGAGDDRRVTAWLSCPLQDPWCPPAPSRGGVLGRAPVSQDGTARIMRFVEAQVDVFVQEIPYCYKAIYDDGDLYQTATAGCTSLESVTVTLPYMPVVELSPPLDAVLEGTKVSVSVQAVDGVGEPIPNQTLAAASLTGGSSVSVATVTPASSCSPKLRGTTGAAGWTTLRICADKTRKWRADGRSIVASRPFQVLVRKKGSPTDPRNVQVVYPAANKVVLKWRRPANKGWSRISKYQVRWSTNRGYNWSSWKSTGLNRRFGAMTLQDGKTYVFQVRAVNGRGGGGTALRRASHR